MHISAVAEVTLFDYRFAVADISYFSLTSKWIATAVVDIIYLMLWRSERCLRALATALCATVLMIE